MKDYKMCIRDSYKEAESTPVAFTVSKARLVPSVNMLQSKTYDGGTKEMCIRDRDLTVSSVSGKSDLDSVGLSVVDSCISGCVNACDRGIFDLDFKAAGYGIMVCCGCSVIYRIDAGVGEGRSIF